MLVNKNDCLVRQKDNAVFRVMLADAEEFCICKMYYDAKQAEWISDYGLLHAFSNEVSSLDTLGFAKAPKGFDIGGRRQVA